MSKANRPPMSMAKLLKFGAKDYNKGKILVCVGKVLDDERKLEVPAMRVCALTFSETARARIVKAGGQCLTFDQLALECPAPLPVGKDGKGCKDVVLLRGRKTARVTNRHFGASGVHDSSAKQFVKSSTHGNRKNRKREMARGKRKSRGFRV